MRTQPGIELTAFTATHPQDQELARTPQLWTELTLSGLEGAGREQALHMLGEGALRLRAMYEPVQPETAQWPGLLPFSSLHAQGTGLTVTSGMDGRYWYDMHLTRTDGQPGQYHMTGLDYSEPGSHNNRTLNWDSLLEAGQPHDHPLLKSALRWLYRQATTLHSEITAGPQCQEPRQARITEFSS
jgi:hypothetical protein